MYQMVYISQIAVPQQCPNLHFRNTQKSKCVPKMPILSYNAIRAYLDSAWILSS